MPYKASQIERPRYYVPGEASQVLRLRGSLRQGFPSSLGVLRGFGVLAVKLYLAQRVFWPARLIWDAASGTPHLGRFIWDAVEVRWRPFQEPQSAMAQYVYTM